MEDMERYGDYNEPQEELPAASSPVLRGLKWGAALLCIAVAAFLLFRIFLFDYYPASVRALTFNETLTEYYTRTGGNIDAKTQKLRFPYDDHERGNFFCGHMVVVPGAGQLQVCVRFNVSALSDIERRYALSGLSPDEPDLFSFRLTDNLGREYTAAVVARDSVSMYRFCRVVADGIKFGAHKGDPAWIRLDIYVKGATDQKPYSSVLIYENHDAYSTFSDYHLSAKEKPQ